jgi:hypothetical protein
VGLVDDQRVVTAQHPVTPQLGQQDAVGHHPHEGAVVDLVGEAHRVAHEVAERRADLLGHPGGDGAGGEPAGLGVADQPGDAPAQVEAHLGDLRALARPGLAGHDDDLVRRDGGHDLVPARRDRQRGGVAQRRHGGPAPLDQGRGEGHAAAHPREGVRSPDPG